MTTSEGAVPVQPTQARVCVEELYLAHHSHVREYLYRMCKNNHLADDLASETFERALRHLRRDDVTTNLHNPPGWLRAVARNLLTDHYRRAANRHEFASATVAEELEDVGSVDEAVIAAEALEEVRGVLMDLTPGQRAVIVLKLVHDLDTRETAERLGRTPQAVRSLRHKAVRRLNEARLTKVAVNE